MAHSATGLGHERDTSMTGVKRMDTHVMRVRLATIVTCADRGSKIRRTIHMDSPMGTCTILQMGLGME